MKPFQPIILLIKSYRSIYWLKVLLLLGVEILETSGPFLISFNILILQMCHFLDLKYKMDTLDFIKG